MTDFVNSDTGDELPTGNVEQFTLSRERMRRMRVALVAEMRTTKFAISNGKDRTHHLRVWGAREVERIDDGWQFHVHMLVDLSGVDGNALAKGLRTAWSGYRQVQTKLMEKRDHQANLMRLAHYMTKARYTSSVGNRREWLSNGDMVTLAQWRDRQSAQWHRFTWNVRGTSLG